MLLILYVNFVSYNFNKFLSSPYIFCCNIYYFLSLYIIMSSANRDNFTYYFTSSSSFYWLIAGVMNFNIMFNRSSKNEYHYHVFDLGGKTFNISLLSILAESLPFLVFIRLKYVPSKINLLRIF